MNRNFRYVFFGSPAIAAHILSELCKNFSAPVAVVSQNPKPAGRGHRLTPTPVAEMARSAQIPTFETDACSGSEMIKVLTDLKVDVFFVVAFGQIFSERLLSVPRLFCLNVHASLLPKYRGAAPVQRAIMNGDATTGISIQKMERKLDAGDILLTRSIPISDTDTTGSLWEKVQVTGAIASCEALKTVAFGAHSFTPQDASLATYAAKIKAEEAIIDWTETATSINCKIRGLNPWPIAKTKLQGQDLKIYSAKVIESEGAHLQPGFVLTDSKSYLHVQCGHQTMLSIGELQLESKKQMDIASFLAAYRGEFKLPRLG